MKQKERYICNGRTFATFEEVEQYAASLGMRVTNTQTIRKGIYLITINS
jgi:hypothetical protein